MAKIAGLEIVFTVNGNSVEIGSETLTNLVSSLRDSNVYKSTYAEFAKSSAYEVREYVAGKNNLDEETVFVLANDPVESVIVNLLGSDAARCLNDDILAKLINRSPRLAEIVACRVDNFEDCNINKLCELLANHSDPVVRRNLAGNYSAPKKILKKLKSDEDPEVSCDAQSSLG